MRSLGTNVARALKSGRRPRKNKKQNMASLLRKIARKNFVNFVNARRLASFRKTFIKSKGDVLRVSSNLPAFIDPHKRHKHESHRKHRRNFPYTLFTVLGIAAATPNNTEEDSLPTSSVSQSLSATTPLSSSHQVKRSASGRFAKLAKGTSNKMALMQQGYRNYMAKRKLDFENITNENEPPSKRNTRSTQVSTAVTLCL